LTDIVNKHLLPVYDRPLIYYPLQALAAAGIKDVMVVIGGKSPGEIVRLLEDGKKFNLNLSYVYQASQGGIAHALNLTRNWIKNEYVCIMLGDNILEYKLKLPPLNKRKSHIFLKEVNNPQDFGNPVFKKEKIIDVIEKPKNPENNLAVIGIYLYYAPWLFKQIDKIKPSERGELEISDVNRNFAKEGILNYSTIQGHWWDVGYNIDGYLTACKEVAEYGANK